MAFHFSGRTFVAGDRLKLPAPSVVPPGAGLIGLCRPTAGNFFNRGFYSPGATSGWIMGRAPSNDRMGLYRPLRTPVVQQSVAAGATTVTTPTFSPPANCTLIAWSAVRDTAAPGTSNMVTSGLTWTLIPGGDVATDDGTVFIRQRAFSTTIGASPPANITVATTTAAVDHNACVVVAVVGGGTSFQVATNPGTAGDATATLAVAPAANSIVLGSFHDRTFPSSITPPANYTQAGLFNVGTNGKLQIVYNETATSSDVAWVTAATGICTAIAIEMRCPALVEHSTATWQDDRVQSFLAFSQSASEHWLALNDAGSLQGFSTNIPIDATSALALGTFDMAGPRGGFVGEHFWIGVLKTMPPTRVLDQVMRQLQPPTVLRPWLAHLFPLMGRSPERCILTNVALNVDIGTTLSNVGVPQPQVELEEGPFAVSAGTSRRRVRVTARNATGDTVLTLDAGPSNQTAAIVVSLPAPAGTTGLGIACNGGALTTATLPSAAPAQQGELFVGTSILDGAAQVEAGSVRIGALAIGPAWTSSVHSALWSIAGNYLRPVVDPIALVGESGAPYFEALAPRIKDPARAGYTLALSGISDGLTAAITGGTNLNWQADADGDYGATLTITSLLSGLAAVTQVVISFAVGLSVPRYANGYQWRAYLRRPAWPGGGSETTLLLPFAELSQRFKTVANGGLVESAAGWDIRFEGAAGQIAHRLLGYDSVGGRAAILLNLGQDLSTTEELAIYLGKAGLLQSEENVALTRQGGWVAWHGGWGLQDLSNLGHTLSDNGSIVDSAIGSWPAAHFNGSNTWRQRASNELNAQPGFFVAALVRSDEAVGRTQEILNIAPNDTAQLAMRLTSQGYWVAVTDVGGQLLSVASDTELYVPSEPHAFGSYWQSGQAPGAVLDGRVIEPSVQPPVASGSTAMDETLEIGRGNRPPGTASYWSGQIGPVLMAAGATTKAQREIVTAALKEPRLVYGLSDFQSADDTVQPFIAMPLQGTAVRGAATSFDVVANAYNPDGVDLTVVVPQPPSNVTASVSGDAIVVNPNNSAGNRVLLYYDLVSSTSLTSSGVLDLTLGAPTGGGGGDPDPGGGGSTDAFPAEVPARPDFSGATVVTATSNSTLESYLAGTIPDAGIVIQLSASTNDFGSVTLNRAGRKIKIVALAPPFDGLITRRDALRRDGTATIDQTNLTPASATDLTIATHCIKGGLRSHTTSNRINLTVNNCGVLWLEGLDFYNSVVTTSGGGTYRLQVQGGNGCDQLWLTKCRGDQSDGYIFSIGAGSEGSATSDRRGADVFVGWGNYLFGHGTIRDPGSSGTTSGVGVLTDYGMRFYNTQSIYLWNNIYAGGYNHSISKKQRNLGVMYVDDCIFASWHPIDDAWAYIEMGQAADLENRDRTAGLNWVRGCTFTDDASAGSGSGRVLLMKNTTGLRFQRNTVYAGVGVFFVGAVGGTGGTGTFTDTGVHPGSQNVVVENNRFRNSNNSADGQPPPTQLARMGGGAYSFTARNNTYSTVRAVSSKGSGVTTDFSGSNPGFSG